MTPFPIGQAVVYGGDGGGRWVDVTSSCQSEPCVAVRERCGSRAFAEVMLARSGAIADVVCYRADLRVDELGAAPVDELSDQPHSVLLVDAIDDGVDVLGDVTLSADDVVLYGAGARVSVLGGELEIVGAGAAVRGLRVDGDVRIDGNGAKLSLLEIHGQLFIDADDVTVNESIVYGRVHVTGAGAVLVRNVLGDNRELEGSLLECNLNQRFDDSDGDGEIADAELGGEVSCG